MSERLRPDREPLLWVNDGRTCLGLVYPAGSEFDAVSNAGEALGRFSDIAQAKKVLQAHALRGVH